MVALGYKWVIIKWRPINFKKLQFKKSLEHVVFSNNVSKMFLVWQRM